MRFLKVLSVTWMILLAVSLGMGQAAPPAEKKEAAAGPRNLTIGDYFAIKRVQDPQISPEGKWVAYTVSSYNLKEDKSESQVWMVPVAGGEAIPMTAKGSSASRARWSPDGKYLAFLASRGENAKAQVWLLNRLGGEAQQLTEVKQGVQSYEWSPDGTKLALTIRDPSPEDLADEKESQPPAKRPKTRPPWVIDRLHFKQDNVGYLDRRRTHLFVFDVASKKMSQVTSGDFDDSRPAWSPDGRFLAFVSNRTEEPDANYNTDIWLVASDNPDQGKTLLQLTTNAGSDTGPVWSPDGKWVAYATKTDWKVSPYATEYLAVVSPEGGASRILTEKLDRSIGSPLFSLDGNYIYFVLEDSGERNLARIPAAGGEITRPITGPRSVTDFEISKDGTVVARISEPAIPGELFVLDARELRQLTKTNDALMAQVRLGEVENIHFKSKDGTEIEGFLYKPPAFNPELRYPTLLRIHGGPIAQYESSFNFEAQLFAANGYVVVTTNPRGSSGYGQAFSMAIFADWGNKDYEDVMAGVDYAIAQAYADPDRLGVGGWSYGGILTNYVITKTDRFKGAISGASLGLVAANYGHDHYQKWYELEFGPPMMNREVWERLSPFNYVEKIVTPTLWIGGEVDWNVPIINSEQMYQAMRRLGRTAQLVVYPGQHHGISKPTYIKDRYERYLAWYAKYVKGEAPAAAEKTGEP